MITKSTVIIKGQTLANNARGKKEREKKVQKRVDVFRMHPTLENGR